MARLLPLIAALLLAAGVVLVTSMRRLQSDRDRLLQSFASDQLDQAREAAVDLQNRLEDLDEDARLLKDLVTRTRSAPGLSREVQDQTTLSSFQALATVVRSYRSILLVNGGTATVAALDPSETLAAGQPIVAASVHAAEVAEKSAQRLFGPFPVAGERSFYFHVSRLGELGSIVIAVEPRRFLAGVLRPRADARQAVEDPSGQFWIGCEAPSTCHLGRPALDNDPLLALADKPSPAPSGTTWLQDDFGRSVGFPPGPTVAAWTEAVPPTGGSWRLLTATSATSARAAMTTAGNRLVGVATALIAVMAGIGSVIVWQQRRAAALQERIRHIERVESLEDQLVRAEKLATTGVLAAGIAHEIGTPLGIIRGRAELLLAEPEGPSLRPALRGIIEQIDHIAGTIGQVLDFSRAQAVSLQPVNVGDAIRATTSLLGHRFARQQVTISSEIGADLPRVAADPAQLQQVLVNVLMNACDACSPGGTVSIRVQLDRRSDRVCWTISDTGCGIEPEHLRAVFDPFFTTKKRGEGTGLGLSVAANILRNHHAEISLASEPGRGTVVTLLWPTAGENANA